MSKRVLFSVVLLLATALVIPSCKKSEPLDQTSPSGAKETTTAPEKQTVAAQDGKVVLELKLPTAIFEGTPPDLRSENLEQSHSGARPPFMVPEGTTNVALNKPVTGSDDEPIIGELEQATDGDKEGSDGSYVELGPMKQYVQIDLEKEYNIYAILVWHYHKQARVYHDVVVQLADDPDFITNVRTVFNSDHDNSSGLGIGKDKEWIETFEGKLIDAGGAKARYVRLYSKGNTSNDLNHYVEVEVYGIAAP